VLLTETVFTIEEQFGNWDRQPLVSTSPEIITIARRSRSCMRHVEAKHFLVESENA
jgi:hypothetical protein